MAEPVVKKEEKGDLLNAVNESLKSFELFRFVKSKLLSADDFAEVTLRDRKTGEIRKRKVILKSGWRKIKTFFKISSEILELKREKEDDKIIYFCKVRAWLPSGVSSEAVGICSSDEPGKKNMSEYVLASIAQTRALNKAIADLVGGDVGEDIDEEVAEQIREWIKEEEEKAVAEKERPELPSKKSMILREVFDTIKELEKNGVSRADVFARIKETLGLDKTAQVRLSDLSEDELSKVKNELSSWLADIMKHEEVSEDVIF